LDTRSRRLGLTVWAAVVGTFLVLPSARAAELSPQLQAMLRDAQNFEKDGQYAQAWEKYYQIRKAEHNPPEEVNRGYLHCLRRAQQAHRLRDKASQNLLGDLEPSDALDVYVKALGDLHKKYFDESKVSLDDLFQQGVREMRLALEDDAFLRDQVRANAKPAALLALKARLADLRENPPSFKKPVDAHDELNSVMLLAGAIGIKPKAVVVEFISGACNALDEYTGYLSPNRLAEIETDLNGKFVGIGVDVAVVSNKGRKQVRIKQVYPGAPADGKLHPEEIIVSIDGQTLDPAAPGAFVAKLQGEPGTKVELVVTDAPGGMKRKVTVERQAVSIPSVDRGYFPEAGIGYVRIRTFHQDTPQDLRSALLYLRSQPEGLKALILDLRGNLGGSFKAALKVSEEFLTEGVIVYTQFRTREKAERASNPDALTLPMVVLVDADTASAAEIVAGALKDNKRAWLMGQPTYGKGSIQCLVKLDSLKAGLQVTVARFSSPERVGYDGHGVTPHELVEYSVSMMSPGSDSQQKAAYDYLVNKLSGTPAPMKMPPMPSFQ
jgi:carboxyl-terminal processing protease